MVELGIQRRSGDVMKFLIDVRHEEAVLERELVHGTKVHLESKLGGPTLWY